MIAQMDLAVKFADIEKAMGVMEGIVHRTPVFTSRTVNNLTGAKVFFKGENLQRTGSFKFRGAYYALSRLSSAQKARGVLTFSSGNHAQAIALAGQLLKIPTTIIMPSDAPLVKQEATRHYGAEIIIYDRQQISRETLCQKIAYERGSVVISPYDHEDVIAGQGTCALELMEEVGELDLLLVACGGGGLLSGCGIVAKTLFPLCQVIGVEPEQADDATRSFYTRTLQTIDHPDTIADGARTPYLGKLTFPLVLEYVDDMVTVSEDAIKRTMVFLWERLKLVIEPTGVLGATPLLEGIIKGKGERIGIILSGGNVDLTQMGVWFSDISR